VEQDGWLLRDENREAGGLIRRGTVDKGTLGYGSSPLSGTLLSTDGASEGSVFLLESAFKQGWPVGLGRWDITKHWIWTDGLVSAARVDDAGDGDYNCRCHRGQMRCVARQGWRCSTTRHA
jgi:hypothetical protein